MRVLRRLRALALALALFPLAACGGTLGDRDRGEAFLEIRAALLARERLDLRADMRAILGGEYDV